MKRKLLMVMLSIVCGVCLAIGLSACGGGSDDKTSDWQNGVYTVQSAYAEAQEYGYSGTLEEFIASISGTDGTNGQDGTDGQDGKDGIGIAYISLNTDGELVITLTDNSSVNLGKIQSGCTHTYGDWVVGEEATCTSMGYKYRTCTKCGYKDYEFTEALGHTYSTEAINCENYAHVFYCTTCNQVITEVHTFDENYYCKTCGCHYYSEGLEFTLSNNQFSVSIGTCTDNNIVIPSVYKGLPVTKIDSSAFYDCATLKSIVIPDSVTEIGELAFSGCTALTSITIPDSVTEIGEAAFSGCTALTSITIPDSVTEIGEAAFGGCTALKSITIPDNVKSIGSWAFYSCTALTNIVIPNSVTVIEDCTFLWCSSLTSITIGSGITSINDDAFAYCYKLVEVNNLSSLTITAGIDDNGGVGYYAKNIYSSTNDESHLITSGDYLFVYDSENNYYLVAYTGSDTALTLPTLTNKNGEIVNYSINQYAFFENSKLTSVTIPNSVTSIGSRAFEECSSLTSVYYNGTASQWASISFSNAYANPLYYAGNLYLNGILATDITLESITSINTYAFYNCNSLINITIPSSLTSIGSSAFCGCTALKAITLGDSVTSIGSRAFYNCTSLTSVTIGDSVTSIGSRAFYGCASLTSVYYNGTASQWASISFGDAYANPLYYAGNLYLDGTLATDITLESITTINDYAFYNCTSLINITISSNLTSVGSNAFYGCSSLESILLISSQFLRLEYKTFSNSFGECSSLTNIYFYGTYEEWNNILNAIYHYVGDTYEDYLASATVYYYSETQPKEEGNYWHYVDGEVAVWTVEE